MPRTRRCNFLVLSLEETCLSLRVIGSTNNGKEVTVPKNHSAYSEKIKSCLCSELEQGTILEAELVSCPNVPEECDEWRFGKVISHRRP